jgi:hypothetical protein
VISYLNFKPLTPEEIFLLAFESNYSRILFKKEEGIQNLVIGKFGDRFQFSWGSSDMMRGLTISISLKEYEKLLKTD